MFLTVSMENVDLIIFFSLFILLFVIFASFFPLLSWAIGEIEIGGVV